MIKKNESPLLSIVVAIAVLLTLIEGAIYLLQVIEKSQNNDMESTNQELTMMVDLLAKDFEGESNFTDFYDAIVENLEVNFEDDYTVSILSPDMKVLYGNDVNYGVSGSLQLYQPGTNYFDDAKFMNVIKRLTDAKIVTVSTAHRDGNLIEQMADYEFVYPEVIYYSYDVTALDGNHYIVILEKNLSIDGRTIQEMVYLSIIYLVIAIVILFLSVCQAIVKNSDFKRLQKVAYYDELTGLPNRKLFEIEAEKLLKHRGSHSYALVSMDINKFKVINDFYGAQTGDTILKGVGEELKKEEKKDELIARDRADVFLMLLEYETLEKLDDRIKRLDTKMSWEFTEQAVHFKYGVYPVPEEYEEVRRLINYSTMARDRSDLSRESNIGYLDDSEREQMRLEKILEGEMEEALMKKEFAIYLQPKFLTDGSKVGGAEALVRWISPVRGVISPNDFIPLFEKNGFVMKLDDYMLEEVCKRQREWLSEGKELITISVNVSRVHLQDPELVENIVAIVDRYDLPHTCIELELTESAFFDDKEVLIMTIRKMQAAGFSVSMDDFGSGYSSLNSLKDLPLDVIKLDAEFFRDAMDPTRGETIVKNTIQMAKSLNMKIVAEGIEREDQVKFLDSIGCDLIQGYYFAKPMTVREFEMLVYKR